MKKVLLAAGGTGGHIFPMISLYKGLEINGDSIILVTDKRVENYINNLNIDFKIIDASSPYKDKNIVKKILNIFLILKSFIQSYCILKKFKPDIVIGCGGYVSFSVLAISKILKIKYVIYETNSVMGRVNKFFSKSAFKIFTGYKLPIGLKNENSFKTEFIGQLVRNNFFTISYYTPQNLNNFFNLMVLGGSQGAKIFSKVIPEVLKKLLNEKYKINIFHQCNENDIDSLKSNYSKFNDSNNFKYKIFSFDPNIEKFYEKTNLVICRAGSSTLAELSIIGIPFIAIPLPSSLDNHQFLNAKYYTDNNCAYLIKQDLNVGKNLYSTLKNFFTLKQDDIKKKSNDLQNLNKIDSLKVFTSFINKI